MFVDLGEISFEDANSANVPVDIWLSEFTNGEEDPTLAEYVGWWRLTAKNYTPRKSCVTENSVYELMSPDRAELAAIVRDQIKPLYAAAMAKIDAMIEGTGESLYYW